MVREKRHCSFLWLQDWKTEGIAVQLLFYLKVSCFLTTLLFILFILVLETHIFSFLLEGPYNLHNFQLYIHTYIYMMYRYKKEENNTRISCRISMREEFKIYTKWDKEMTLSSLLALQCLVILVTCRMVNCQKWQYNRNWLCFLWQAQMYSM